MAVLGLHFCARAFSSCGKRGPLFIAVRWPLTIAASLVAEHRLQTRRLSNCGSRAQLLCGMWDPPRPGHEPMSPALAGRLSTTAPPGKPYNFLLSLYCCPLFNHWESIQTGFCVFWLVPIFLEHFLAFCHIKMSQAYVLLTLSSTLFHHMKCEYSRWQEQCKDQSR